MDTNEIFAEFKEATRDGQRTQSFEHGVRLLQCMERGDSPPQLTDDELRIAVHLLCRHWQPFLNASDHAVLERTIPR